MYKLFLAALAVLGFASSIQAATITEIATGNEDFSTLATALEKTGLDDVLDCEWLFCRYTVFAPTDTAFTALGDLGTKLLTDDWEAHLRLILLYHVAYGYYDSGSIPNDGEIYTLLVESVNTTVTGTDVMINDATVLTADIEASNGYIHAIDQVLIPSFMQKDIIATATEAGHFGKLLNAVDVAGLTATLKGDGPFTLFAPTDNAFDKLGQGVIDALLENTTALEEILKYHVISGEIVLAEEFEDGVSLTSLEGSDIDVSVFGFWKFKFPYLNKDVRISFTDILTSNGVIHVLDTVLIPSTVTPPEPTIAEILEADPTLSTLVTALKTAGLFDTFSGPGPFTLFAPSNDAFAELGDLLDDSAVLAPILTYHVVGAEVVKADLESGAVETLNGASVIADPGFFWSNINDARITFFDLKGSNGVVHIINEVLMPPADNCLEVAEANGLTAFVAAVDAAGLSNALTDPDAKLSIFAPQNSAFDDLEGDDLTQAQLVEVLTYHVVPTVASLADLSDGDVLPTLLEGASIDVEIKYVIFGWFFLGLFLNDDAEVVSTDLLCSNGIIHQIDKVLTP